MAMTRLTKAEKASFRESEALVRSRIWNAKRLQKLGAPEADFEMAIAKEWLASLKAVARAYERRDQGRRN